MVLPAKRNTTIVLDLFGMYKAQTLIGYGSFQKFHLRSCGND